MSRASTCSVKVLLWMVSRVQPMNNGTVEETMLLTELISPLSVARVRWLRKVKVVAGIAAKRRRSPCR